MKEIVNKSVPYLIVLILLILISGCSISLPQHESWYNPPPGSSNFVHIYCPSSVKDTESFNLLINYKITSSTNLSLRIYMEDDSVGYITPPYNRRAQCSVYNKSDIFLYADSCWKIINLKPTRDFVIRQGECGCFPNGINDRSYVVFADLTYNLKDSTVLTVGRNRYKVDYYFVKGGYGTINYDVLKEQQNNSNWFKVSDFFNSKVSTTLDYPSGAKYFTNLIAYDSNGTNLNEIYGWSEFEYYINKNGLSYSILNGEFNKDRDILFGFGNPKFGKLYLEPFTFGVTKGRTTTYNNTGGYASISVIAFPKFEHYLDSLNFNSTKKDLNRRALVTHELGHGRSSDCYDHPQNNESSNVRNCIMNTNIGINSHIIDDSVFVICDYHKFMIQRRFWYPANLNLLAK